LILEGEEKKPTKIKFNFYGLLLKGKAMLFI